MKVFAALAFGLLALPSALSAQAVESGYPRGSLGVAAIERGDWTRAEALLSDRSFGSRTDPARLINLGAVYMQTGRTAEAIAAWRQALNSTRHVEVETLSGRWVTTDQVAREALSRYATASVERR